MKSIRLSSSRRAVSMVEALIAVTVTTIAGAALLTSIGGAVRASSDATNVAVARGLGDQLMGEISAARFPLASNTVPAEPARMGFDDIDDYDGWNSRPAVDREGRPLGTEGYDSAEGDLPRLYQMRPDAGFLNQFSREVFVERLLPDAGTGWTVVPQHTNHRRVIVRVKYIDANSNAATLAEVVRIFSYVPFAP